MTNDGFGEQTEATVHLAYALVEMLATEATRIEIGPMVVGRWEGAWGVWDNRGARQGSVLVAHSLVFGEAVESAVRRSKRAYEP